MRSTTKRLGSDAVSNSVFYASSSTTVPNLIGLRDFVRGGLRELTEPTLILDGQNRVLGTWVPGTIDTEFRWTAEEPEWLKGEDR